MNAITSKIKKLYMGPEDRSSYIITILLSMKIEDWAKESKVLTDDEKNKLLEATKIINNTSAELSVRSGNKFTEKLLKEIDDSIVYIENAENAKLNTAYGYRNVLMDEVYDLADCAMDKCINCQNENFEECERYKLFINLMVPPAHEGETCECPYKN